MDTGLSNSLGGQLIRDDCTRREIEEIVTEVFGEEAMGEGVTSQNGLSDHDPFDSGGSFLEKDDILSQAKIVPNVTLSLSVLLAHQIDQISIQYWLLTLKVPYSRKYWRSLNLVVSS